MQQVQKKQKQLSSNAHGQGQNGWHTFAPDFSAYSLFIL